MKSFRIYLALVAATVVGSSVGAGAASVASRASQCFGPQPVLHGGVYRTGCFVPGMRVTVPARWQIGEDSKLELKLLPPHSRNPDTPALRFWLDPHASTACTDVPVQADMSTPAAAVAWLRGNKNLVVSAPHRTTVGKKKIPARYVDLNDSRHAPKCSPTCPGPCIDYFLFHAPETATEPYGTGRGEPVRLYFAEVRSPANLFVFGVDTPSAAKFAKLTPVAAKILDTLRLPHRLPSRRGR
jgi:hypothetical protein